MPCSRISWRSTATIFAPSATRSTSGSSAWRSAAVADLRVVLDEPQRTWRPGDVVTGHVAVRTYEQQKCEWLRVGVLWHTHGRGNPDRGEASGATLFEAGEWAAGEVEY